MAIGRSVEFFFLSIALRLPMGLYEHIPLILGHISKEENGQGGFKKRE